MMQSFRLFLFFASVCTLVLLGAYRSGMATSQPSAEGPLLEITDVRAFETPDIENGNGAVFLTITNKGHVPDKLLSAEGDVAETIELHNHIHENGVMKMRPVDVIDVPADGSVVLKPMGYHVMLIGLTEPLKAGDHFPLRLFFETSGPREIQVSVEPRTVP